MNKEQLEKYLPGEKAYLWRWDYIERKPKLQELKRRGVSFYYDNDWEAHLESVAYYSVYETLEELITYVLSLLDAELQKIQKERHRIEQYLVKGD